jgi:hypothetical protein
VLNPSFIGFTSFEFLFELEIKGVPFLLLFLFCPSGDFFFVTVHDSFEFQFDVGFGETGVFIGFFVAGVDTAVVPMFSVEVPDEDVCEILRASISGFEPFDVAVGDEPAVEIEELVEFLVHPANVFLFYDFLEAFDDRDHGVILLAGK